MRPSAIPSDRLMKELASTSLLRDLAPRELKRFAPICDIREYGNGERLVEQDSLGPDLHLLLEGQVYSLLRRLGATNRELMAERESVVTSADLDRLRSTFPKSLEDMLEG